MTVPSLSQELEDTISFNNTWTSSNTSRITSMKTSPTDRLFPTSSRSPRMLKPHSTPSTTTVSSLIQLASTQRLSTNPRGPPSNSEIDNDPEKYLLIRLLG